MPAYDFLCMDCGKIFVIKRPMNQSDLPADCPNCGSKDTRKKLAAVYTKGCTTSSVGGCSGCSGGSCSSCSH